MQTLVLVAGKERTIELRHPWIYSGALRKPVQMAGHAQLSDGHGQIIATGFAEPGNSLALRVVHWGTANLLSPLFWEPLFTRAFELRKQLVIDSHTNCYRLIHGEADGIPGLIVDVYADVAVLQSGWAGAETCVPIWSQILNDMGFKNILRKRAGSNKPGQWQEPEGVLSGEIPAIVEVVENGIAYGLDLRGGQKTGFFLDQRDNRQLVRTLSAGKRVLNTFCYTGGFSLAAGLGNAQQVVSVDVSQHALDELTTNWNLNQERNGLQTPHTEVCADVFEWLRSLEPASFDLVILDPPAFATSKAALPRATRGYKDILLQGIKATAPGGLVMIYSCSQHIGLDLLQKISFGAALDSKRQVQVLRRLSAGMDHPFSLYHPEGEYLKGLLLRVS